MITAKVILEVHDHDNDTVQTFPVGEVVLIERGQEPEVGQLLREIADALDEEE